MLAKFSQHVADQINHIDLQMVFLNFTSIAGIIAWVQEKGSGLMGGLLIFSVVILNWAKAYSVVIRAKADVKEKKEEEDEKK